MKKIIVGIMVVSLSTMALADSCYSEGIRVGTVQKFSNMGFINKSWEGELVMEGTKIKGSSNGSVKGGNVWAFSATDPTVAKTIEEVMMTGGEVALKYCQTNPLVAGAQKFSTNTTYIVTKAVERK